MARYTGPTNKLYRNYGVKDLSNRKLTSSMRQTESGQHGAMRKKLSEYALHLNEKQKIRLTYLVSEKQFAKYYNEAKDSRRELKQARRETAEKILNTIYDKLNTFEAVYEIDYESYVDDVLWEIAKQFGLEIKE